MSHLFDYLLTAKQQLYIEPCKRTKKYCKLSVGEIALDLPRTADVSAALSGGMTERPLNAPRECLHP